MGKYSKAFSIKKQFQSPNCQRCQGQSRTMKKIIFLELFLRIIEDEKWNLFEKLGQLGTPTVQLSAHLHILLLHAYLVWLKIYIYYQPTTIYWTITTQCLCPLLTITRGSTQPKMTIDILPLASHLPPRPPLGATVGDPAVTLTNHPMLSTTLVLQVHNNYCDLMTGG